MATYIAGSIVDSDNNPGHKHAVSKKEALSIIAKLRAGKSSVMAEARRLGVYHATVRKELRAALGSKEYAKLWDDIRRLRKLSPSPKVTRERKQKPAVAKTLPANGKVSEQAPSPKPETDPRGENRRKGSLYLQPLGSEIAAGETVEVKLGETHVLLLQRLGSSVRITSARRTSRTFTDALVLGGTVIVPHDRMSDVCDALREAAG